MEIKISDVVNIVESYRNKNDFTHQEMAKLFGMASKSTYNQFVNKEQNIGIQSLLNFLNNTETTLESFLLKFYILNKAEYVINSEDSASPYKIECTNPKCIKEKEALQEQIRSLINANEKLATTIYRKMKGGINQGESSGGVETPGKTG